MPTSAVIRWGILGVAAINDRLLPAFRAAAGSEVRAIASREAAKARAAAHRADIPIACGSYEELLGRSDIDAVYIPLPNHLHAEWTRRAADAGKHVLCEKPLTLSASEAAELVAYCRSRDVRLMDGTMWPHHPRTAAMRHRLDAGDIGAVRHVTAAFTFRMHPLDPTNIRLQPQLGGGSLLDVGWYCVYGIRWAMAAEPVQVRAVAEFAHGVDVNVRAWLDFADDRTAAFDCGFTTPLRPWLEVAGTEGVLSVPEMWVPSDPAVYRISRPSGPVSLTTHEFAIAGHDQMVHMLHNFAQAIREDRDPNPSPTEAVRTLRVLDALAESARNNGQPVTV